ncbi:two pore domain potassium channel family protein [Exilibacterium tricleocarpae]|uniref:Two pore domain potassium channel family protein n=1 Tax=Exilibacterium tricleocarpae TaxID=2591008 RepID=A0A545T5W1_9GAMM|nr:potassium channel family protein [Exilibacterium tricleocarpae]TQV72627.1 two pore domain potassium channel family protein [Exilibacterium tricleocarpae]
MLDILLINSLLIAAVVIIHFEALTCISNILPRLPDRRRFKILFGIFGSLAAHVVEIWAFALGYYLLIQEGDFGLLQGNTANTLLDCAYFSFTTYTSLGLGDVEPIGKIRYLAGLESLTGLVLIGWTASFMYIEMQRYWTNNK